MPQLSLEVLTAGGVEHCPTPARQSTDAFKSQRYKVSIDEPVVATSDSNALNSHMQSSPDHSSDSGIHPWSITTTGEYANAANWLIHVPTSQNTYFTRFQQAFRPSIHCGHR